MELKYNALGEVSERKDNNQSVHDYDYDDLGRLVNDRVTSFGTGVDNGVKRISRSYEVRGMLSDVSSYDNAAVGSGSVLNEVKLSYNSFGQLLSDQQEHSGAVNSSTSRKTQYGYADGSANQLRPTSVTYPNGRVVDYLYADAGDTSGLSDVLSRVSAIATNTTRGTSDANVIASYDYLGLNQMQRRSYPTPKLKLDYTGSSSGSFSGWDNFGRTISQDWVNYNSTAFDAFKINHGYDRDSNRLYAANVTTPGGNQDPIYDGSSHVYGYDNLNRLTADSRGLIASDNSAIQSFWQTGHDDWTLDVLGNQTATKSSYFKNTPDAANKYTARTAKGTAANPELNAADGFTTSTTSNWKLPAGSGAAFSINTTSHVLSITAVSTDTFNGHAEEEARAVLTWGAGIGPTSLAGANISFPSGATSGQAGLVYGYKSINDYWVRVYDLDQHIKVYHIVNGVKSLIFSASVTVNTGTAYGLLAPAVRGMIGFPWAPWYTDGCPSGKVGVYSTLTGVTFDTVQTQVLSPMASLLERWDGGGFAVDGGTNRLLLWNNWQYNSWPLLLKNLRLQKFQATFSQSSPAGGFTDGVLAFNAMDAEDYDVVYLHSDPAGGASLGYQVINGQPVNYFYASASAPPAPGARR